MTHITSCRSVISIEHATSVFLAFWLVLARILYGLVKNVSLYCVYTFSTQNYMPFKISASSLLLKYF